MTTAVVKVFFTIAACITIASASSKESESSEEIFKYNENGLAIREISDLNVINGRNGVPIELWYNETTISPDELVSAVGCPQSIDGIPWIYYGQPPKCFLAGTYAQCPPDQKLLTQKGSPYGVCACECLTEFDFSEQLQGPNRYVRCFRTQNSIPPPNEQIFDKVEKKCYFMYERGPCKIEGTVLTDMTSQSLKCLPLCDQEKHGWKKMEEAGLCKSPIYVLGAANPLSANQCPNGEIFSKILKKCIRRSFGKNLIVG